MIWRTAERRESETGFDCNLAFLVTVTTWTDRLFMHDYCRFLLIRLSR